jgi:hypothetical protein
MSRLFDINSYIVLLLHCNGALLDLFLTERFGRYVEPPQVKRRDTNKATAASNAHGESLRSRPLRFSEAGEVERPKVSLGPMSLNMKWILLMVAAG